MFNLSIAPRVSVIIPTYNCQDYIIQAIESVLSQTDCNFELLVLDDGSTDETRTVLEPYQNRLRYIYQLNQGVASARNHGIREARGELVAFLDADDYFLPNKLAAQVARFDAEPELGIVHSGWQRVDAKGQLLKEIKPWEYIPELNLENWLKWKPVLPSAMMFRRHWLQFVDGFDARFPPAEDTDLALRLALKGCRAGWLRRITVGYRQHPGSAMHKGLPQARSLSAVLDNFFAQPDLPVKIRLLERKVRHDTLIWIAWYLYYTDHPEEMVQYLKLAWQYKSYLPLETIVNWSENFVQFSQQWEERRNGDSPLMLPQWQNLFQWIITQI
jgi:glycosyltransferase involved in cell wall biosynthesis